MKIIKTKAFAAVILVASILSISACGSNDKTSQKSDAESVSQSGKSTAISMDASDTENSSDESTGNSSEESTEASKPDSTDTTDAKESGDLPALKDDDGKDVGYMNSGLLIYNRTAYEMFYGNDDLAKNYAEAVNGLCLALGDNVELYSVLVPTHCGVTLPERFYDEYGIADQEKYIDTIFYNMLKSISPVHTYDTLAHHRDEYIYFNTDHHWTGLGAYYAYKQFCKTAGVDYLKLSDLEEGTIDGYFGSLTREIDTSLVDQDTVHYYTADKDTETFIYDVNGENPQQTTLFHTYAEGGNAYGVFLGGDSPLMVCKNKNGNGKKIAVLKESYGNAFSPLIALTYSETHMIDFRYIEFDFLKYIKDNNIDQVILINNTMASATPMRCDEIRALYGQTSEE